MARSTWRRRFICIWRQTLMGSSQMSSCPQLYFKMFTAHYKDIRKSCIRMPPLTSTASLRKKTQRTGSQVAESQPSPHVSPPCVYRVLHLFLAMHEQGLGMKLLLVEFLPSMHETLGPSLRLDKPSMLVTYPIARIK